MTPHIFTPRENMPSCCGYVINESGNICNGLSSQHGECDCCTNQDKLIQFRRMNICSDCYQKEISGAHTSQELDKVTIALAQKIDQSIQLSTDAFNAQTVSINELKNAIENDESIPNKPYTLAAELLQRFENFKTIMFDAQKRVIDSQNNMKAIQVYLNNLAVSLRTEEREKLKISDINYKPLETKPKTIKVGTIGAPKKKFTQVEVIRVARELNVAPATIQMLCVAKNITPSEAGELIKSMTNKKES